MESWSRLEEEEDERLITLLSLGGYIVVWDWIRLRMFRSVFVLKDL